MGGSLVSLSLFLLLISYCAGQQQPVAQILNGVPTNTFFTQPTGASAVQGPPVQPAAAYQQPAPYVPAAPAPAAVTAAPLAAFTLFPTHSPLLFQHHHQHPHFDLFSHHHQHQPLTGYSATQGLQAPPSTSYGNNAGVPATAYGAPAAAAASTNTINYSQTNTRPVVTSFDFAPGTPHTFCLYGVQPVPVYNTPYKKCIPNDPMCGFPLTCIMDVDENGRVLGRSAGV